MNCASTTAPDESSASDADAACPCTGNAGRDTDRCRASTSSGNSRRAVRPRTCRFLRSRDVKSKRLEFIELLADRDRTGKPAVDILEQHDGRGDGSADVDNKLDDLDPDDRFHSAVEREDDHHDARAE